MSSKRYTAVFILLILSPGCIQSRLENNLAEHSQKQDVTLKSLQDSYSLKKRDKISWSEASRVLEHQNATLQRSRDQIESAKKQRKDQWLSLIPKIHGFAGLSKSLSGLADLSSDDINAQVLASFNIPNPVRFYGQFYAIALQSLQAEWSYELTRRRLYAQLYTSFLEEKMLRERSTIVLQKEQFLDRAPIGKLSGMVASLAQEKRYITRSRSYHRLALNRLLNTPGRHWQPHGRTPTVSYENSYQNLKLGGRFGKLALKLQTIQIETSALAILNIKLRQLPSMSQGLSSPVLFSSDETTQTGTGTDNFFLFAGISKTIDLTDITGRGDLRKAKARAKYTRDQLKHSMESEIQRLNLLKQSYSRAQADQKKLTRRMNYLKKKNTGALNTLLKEYKEYQELEEEGRSLNAQLARMDIQFWLWDDVYWQKN